MGRATDLGVGMSQTQLKMDIETLPLQITRDKNCPLLEYRHRSSSKARSAYCLLRKSFQFNCVLGRRMNLLVDEGQAVKICPGAWAAATNQQELERKAKA